MVSVVKVRPRFASAAALLVLLAAAVPHFSVTVKEANHALDHLAFARPELHVTAQHAGLETLRTEGAASLAASFDAFRSRNGGTWRLMGDRLSGTPSLIEGSGISWIPGSGNDILRPEQGIAVDPSGLARMAELALDLVRANPGLFPARPDELVLLEEASGPRGDYLHFVSFAWTHRGVPVEKAYLSFRLNHGNLVQIGQEWISRSIDGLDALPAIDLETAWQIVWGYTGRDGDEEVVEPGSLRILPAAAPEILEGGHVPAGEGVRYHLAYIVSFRRPGVTGTWEARVDAHTGEILSFMDRNLYGRVHGGVYATDGAAAEEDRPLPFTDVGEGLYADAAGRFEGFDAASALDGRYVRIWDACGPVEHATDLGDLDFGMSPGSDCSTPGFGGEGNTRAARTQYYHISLIQKRARTYLPDIGWLDRRLTDNVNLAGSCNAWWDGRNVNFLQSSSYCGNTGELPGVSLHEWGHGLDQNDGNGSSPELGTAETYGDFTAVLQSHRSCAGMGFLRGNCDGYGDACTSCTGVRDIDWNKHRSRTPATTQNFTQPKCPNTSSYFGPCLREGHCESAVSSQALWDLVTRDLPASGVDPATAWQFVDRLWYLSRSVAGGAFTCDPVTFESDGCGAGSLFNTFRLVDDCDGDLSNGTPHAAAIYAAFNRHGIACAGVNNLDQEGCCPDLPASQLQASLATDGVDLAWTPVAGAERYRIWKNENSCDSGNVLLGTVDAAKQTFSDVSVVWGLTYHYRVQPVGASDACEGAASECASVELPSHPGIHHFSHTLEDVCDMGGGGSGNGVVDPGERVRITLTAGNTSPTDMTQVRAAVSVSSPDVTLVQPAVAFPDLPSGASAQSTEPLVLEVHPAYLCSDAITVFLEFTADQGSWEDAFRVEVGEHYALEQGTVLQETFSSWPPQGWIIQNHGGDCVWTSTGEAGKPNGTGGGGAAAVADSDGCGDETTMHTSLISPPFDLDHPLYDEVELRYHHLFRDYYGTTRGFVEISQDGGGTWTALESLDPGSVGSGYGLRTVDLGDYLGQTGLRVRFRYQTGKWEEYWEVDDVEVAYTIHPYCLVEGCDTGLPLGLTAGSDGEQGIVPVAVAFEGHPDGGHPPYTYAWDFGDGGTSASRFPVHVYETAGSRAWVLTVTDAGGAVETESGVFVAMEPCSWTCGVQVDPERGDVPLEVSFTSLDTASSCGLEPEYAWDFGDGTGSADAAPAHMYGAVGTYDWSLTVTAGGETCFEAGTVVVEEPCRVTCSAEASAVGGTIPLEIAFDSTSVASSCDGDPAYAWDFGDGGSSSEARPTHTYTLPGSYTWTFTVALEDRTCSDSGTVEVLPAVPGDCDGNGTVSIGEVQGATNMFLGSQPVACGADCDGSGDVSIGELQKVINAFLGLDVTC